MQKLKKVEGITLPPTELRAQTSPTRQLLHLECDPEEFGLRRVTKRESEKEGVKSTPKSETVAPVKLEFYPKPRLPCDAASFGLRKVGKFALSSRKPKSVTADKYRRGERVDSDSDDEEIVTGQIRYWQQQRFECDPAAFGFKSRKRRPIAYSDTDEDENSKKKVKSVLDED